MPMPMPSRSAPIVQSYSAPVQGPELPTVIRQPEIAAASLVKAPQPEQDTRGLFQKALDYFNPEKGAESIFGQDNSVTRTFDRLAGGNSIVGQNGYFNKQVIEPFSTGLRKVKEGNGVMEKGAGALDTLRGGFNASPIGLATNAAISSTSGLIKASKGENVNPLEEFNNNSQISGAVGVTNPVAALAIDIATNTLAANPKGVLAGAKGLVNVKNAENIPMAVKTLFQSGKDILGLNPKTSGFASQDVNLNPFKAMQTAKQEALTVAPGIKSVNPVKVAQVDDAVNAAMQPQPIATLMPNPDDLTPGIQRSFNPTTGREIGLTSEDAQLAIPAFQRNQEAARLAEEARVAAIPQAPIQGPRTMNDLDPILRNAQDMDLSASIPPATQTNLRPIAGDISVPLKKAPVGQAPEQIPGVSRPLHETQIENAINAGDFTTARQIVNSLPDTDPYKASSTSLLDAISPEPVVPPVAAVVPESPLPVPDVAPPVPAQVAPEIPQPVAPAIPKDSVAAAPDLRNAVKRAIGDVENEIPKNSPMRESLVIEETMNRARGIVNDIPEERLIKDFIGETTFNSASDYAYGDAALRKLYAAAKNGVEGAAEAADNVLAAMQQGSSKSAQYLRITQQAFNEMPMPMKINRVIKGIQKTLGQRFGEDSDKVSDLNDPVIRRVIERKLDDFFSVDQSIRDDLASAQNNLDEVTTNRANYSKPEIKAAGEAVNAVKERLSKHAQDFAKFYDELVPAKSKILDKVGDYQRTAMLTSVMGRVADVQQTTGNVLREIPSTMLEGVMGRVLNKVTGSPGKFVDRGIGVGSLVKAVPNALKKTAQEFRGEGKFASVSDVVQGVKQNADRTDLTGASKGLGTRLVKAATNFPTHLSEGIKGGETLRLLRQEGLKAGMKGEDLDKFVLASSYNPPANVAKKATIAHEKVNNLNDNPVTKMLTGFAKNVEENGGPVGKVLANGILPFRSWLGGNIWNSVTDRNVIANTVKFVANIKKDPQLAVQQLSKAITGAGEAYAVGYGLAESGVITEEDANGDSYDGIYLHVGDRYIPAKALGALMPNVILGYATHKAFNDENEDGSEDSLLTNLSQTASNIIGKAALGLDISSVMGGDGYISKAITQAGDDPNKALATAASGIASQFIPSVGGDVNAVLNNSTDMNPTQEAAETKAINEETGKTDIWGTALNQLKNRVPVLSQGLERKEGVTAPDLFDRMVKGTRAGEGTRTREQEAADSEVKVADRVTKMDEYGLLNDNIKGVLDKDSQKIFDKIKSGKKVTEKEMDSLMAGATKGVTEGEDTRFLSDGDYDGNLAVLKAKRGMLEADPTTRKDTLEAYDQQIKRGEIYKNLKVPYKNIKDYKEISLEEWRALGDPESDDYDPERYQQLWDMDTAMTEAGVSRKSSDPTKAKYYVAKAKGKGKGKGGVPNNISSNTVGSPVSLGKVSLSKITGSPAAMAQPPKIAKLKSTDLVKKRKISVSR